MVVDRHAGGDTQHVLPRIRFPVDEGRTEEEVAVTGQRREPGRLPWE